MKKNILKHLVFLLVITLYYLVLYLLDITCPFLEIFDYPCPGCGSTRAIMSLLRGDWRGYLYYNPMSLVIIFALFIAFHKILLTKYVNKKYVDLLVIFLSIIIFGFYIYRTFF